MNIFQRIIVLIMVILIAVCCLYPPWVYTYHAENITEVQKPAGYRSIFSPPRPEVDYSVHGVRLDVARLVAECVTVVALGLGLIAVGSRRARRPQTERR